MFGLHTAIGADCNGPFAEVKSTFVTIGNTKFASIRETFAPRWMVCIRFDSVWLGRARLGVPWSFGENRKFQIVNSDDHEPSPRGRTAAVAAAATMTAAPHTDYIARGR